MHTCHRLRLSSRHATMPHMHSPLDGARSYRVPMIPLEVAKARVAAAVVAAAEVEVATILSVRPAAL